jgi:tetratricopeptide (TPR) repeat protein
MTTPHLSRWHGYGLAFALIASAGCAHDPAKSGLSESLSAQEHTAQGHALIAQHDPQKATEHYLAAISQNPDYAPALMGLGNLAYDAKNWEAARGYYKQILKTAPDDPAALNNLAMLNLAEGKDLDDVRAMLEHALPAAGPLRPYLFDTLAAIALRQGRFDDARHSLDQAEAASQPAGEDFTRSLKQSREHLSSAADAEKGTKVR